MLALKKHWLNYWRLLKMYDKLKITDKVVNEEQLHKLCIEVAALSPCKKRKVGAVLVYKTNMAQSPDYDILSYGYNYDTDAPTGSCECEDGTTKSTVIHAEQAAINNAIDRCNKKELKNHADANRLVMYVTYQPCTDCLAALNYHRIPYKVVGSFMKFDSTKPRMQLVPASLAQSCARALTYGAKKYKVGNWRQTPDIECYISALQRHIDAWREGEDNDPESGLCHLDHVAANLAFLIELQSLPKIKQ